MEEDPDFEINISLQFKEDFRRLRAMLNKAEEIVDLVPDWHKAEAEALHDEILQLTREIIDARPTEKSQSEDP